MILPTTGLRPERSLLGIGAELLLHLLQPKTVGRLWQEFNHSRYQKPFSAPISYDWFTLALDLLYIFDLVTLQEGQIHRKKLSPNHLDNSADKSLNVSEKAFGRFIKGHIV